MEQVLTLETFLLGLLTIAGISGAQGVLISIGLEWLPGYEDLQPKTKRGAAILLCFAIPLGSILIMLALKMITKVSQDLIFVALMNAWGVAFITNQGTHMVLYEGNGKGRTPHYDYNATTISRADDLPRGFPSSGPRPSDREDYKRPPGAGS